MQWLTRFFSACVFAGLLVACGGANSSSSMVPPADSPPSAPPAGLQTSDVSPAASPNAAFPNSNRVSFEGKIVALLSGGYTMLGIANQGNLHIYTASSTKINTYGGTATVGHYALLVGSGSTSTSITAAYVATFTTEPGQVTLHGTYVGATGYGFEMKAGGYGIVPIMTSTATSLSGTLVVGGAITVEGTGSSSAAILAASVASAGTAPSYPSTISQTHVITADYLGSPDGTTAVTPAKAAPYLTWAETGIVNTQAIAAAGIKTMVYVDMNRMVADDALYATLTSSEYEETCAGARVSDDQDNVTQYVVNPASSAARTAIDAYVTTYMSGHTVDAIYEDDADPLSQYAASYFSPGVPCSYSDAAWIAGEKDMIAGFGHDVIVNGFSGMTSAAPISNTTRLLTSSTTSGGNMESCYVERIAPTEEGSWVWTGTENTSLQVTSESKSFDCWAMDFGEASSAIASRIYALASFLMTYNPTYSVFRESYATPSGLHVMPESQFVPTAPVVAQPTDVSALEESYVYVREYRACYYDGKLVGQCAMVVNNDTAAHATPALALTYQHTLTLSGNGVLDGGSVGFGGSAPPSSVAPRSAFIAVP